MKNEWDTFFVEKAEKIFSEKGQVIDIGGTLGLKPGHASRGNKTNLDFLQPYAHKYIVLDKVPDYHPNIVGDIHALPLADNSTDAILCLSVLEHVENPIIAVEEVRRVLKPGGYALFYAPFLYHYHPEEGYYKDFYRITYDGWGYLTREFSSVELSPVHGPIATLANLTPLFYKKAGVFAWLDRLLYPKSRQVSGYNVFCVK